MHLIPLSWQLCPQGGRHRIEKRRVRRIRKFAQGKMVSVPYCTKCKRAWNFRRML